MLCLGITAVSVASALGPVLGIALQATAIQALVAAAFMMMGLLSTGGLVAMTAGALCCIAVPAESKSRSMILATIGLQAIGFMGSIGVMVITMKAAVNGTMPQPGDVGLMQLFQVVTGVIWMGSSIAFVVFLKRLNLYLQAGPLVTACASLVSWTSGFLLFYLFYSVVMLRYGQPTGGPVTITQMQLPAMLASVGFILFGLYVFLRLAILLFQTAHTITLRLSMPVVQTSQ